METIGTLKFFGGDSPKLWTLDQRENGEIILRSPRKTGLPTLRFKMVKKLGNKLQVEDVRSGTVSRFNMVKVLDRKQLEAKFPAITTIGVVNVKIVYRQVGSLWHPSVSIHPTKESE